MMVIKDTDVINQITKQLYPEIADKYHTTPSRVEKSNSSCNRSSMGKRRAKCS